MTREEFIEIVNNLPSIGEVDNEQTVVAIQLAEIEKAELKSKIDRLTFAIDETECNMRRFKKLACEVHPLAYGDNSGRVQDREMNLCWITFDTFRAHYSDNVKVWRAELAKAQRALKRVEKQLKALREKKLPVNEFYYGLRG